MQTHTPQYANFQSSKNIIVDSKNKHQLVFEKDFPIKVNYTRFNEAYHLTPNFHDYFEVAYLLNGSAKIRIRNEEYQLTMGDMVIIGDNLIHTYEACNNLPADFIWIAFLPEAVHFPGDSGINFEYIRPFYEQENNFLIPGQNLNQNVPENIANMYNLIHEKENHYKIQTKTYLYEILTNILLYYDNFQKVKKIDYNKRRKDLERLQSIFDYMHNHYEDKITLEEASRVACMSKHYFCRFFKKVVGSTFLEYLMKIRIDKAKELILQGKKTNTEIAYDTGFDNLSYFYRIFKRLTHMNPGEFLAAQKK